MTVRESQGTGEGDYKMGETPMARMKTTGGSKTYYKVVRRNLDVYKSATYLILPHFLVLEYRIGRTTIPNIGGILAFKKLRDARAWFGCWCRYSWAILRGKGIQTDLGLTVDRRMYPDGDKVNDPWPKGTVALSEFTPTGVVRSPSTGVKGA